MKANHHKVNESPISDRPSFMEQLEELVLKSNKDQEKRLYHKIKYALSEYNKILEELSATSDLERISDQVESWLDNHKVGLKAEKKNGFWIWYDHAALMVAQVLHSIAIPFDTSFMTYKIKGLEEEVCFTVRVKDGVISSIIGNDSTDEGSALLRKVSSMNLFGG